MSNLDFKGFPTTRYQGSKRKLLPWIYKNIKSLNFKTALDVFGGTASVSYLLKRMGRKVIYNDYLRFNYLQGKALIENNNVILNDSDLKFLTSRHKSISYNFFVQKTFHDIYYTDEENAWIDKFLCNLKNISNIYDEDIAQYKKALAFSAFAQSALKKRPFNLFHRSNLYLRLNKVKRSFGNKTSWDGSFEKYLKYVVKELNKSVFDNKKKNTALNMNASDLNNKEKIDFVYLDPPYVRKGVSTSDVDYMRFYHFLDGASDPESWEYRINYDSSNLRMEDNHVNEWISPQKNRAAFENLFETFRKSVIVVSYKEPGIPKKRELIYSLKKYKVQLYEAYLILQALRGEFKGLSWTHMRTLLPILAN